MADVPESTKLLPCPFCGANPHRGPEKVRHCQMHGDPLQDYSIWCPKGHAKLTERSETVAIAAWNTRAAPPAMDREAVIKECAQIADNHVAMGYMSGRGRDYCHEHGDEIAAKIRALSTLSADAIRQGEGIDRELAYSFVGKLKQSQKADAASSVGIPLDWSLPSLERDKAFLRAVAEKGKADDLRMVIAPMLPATPASHASDGGKA